MIGLDRGVDWLAGFETGHVVEHLVDAIGPSPRPVVAFSLGAMPALMLAEARPDLVSALTLVAPAGPWEQGRFADDMAGTPLFALAAKSSRRLALVAMGQATMLRFAPDLFLKTLFKSAPAAEQTLIADAPTHMAIADGYRWMLTNRFRGYLAALKHYARDWMRAPLPPTLPLRIVAGGADTWVPTAMVAALATRLGGGDDTRPETVPNTGHYGTLLATPLDL